MNSFLFMLSIPSFPTWYFNLLTKLENYNSKSCKANRWASLFRRVFKLYSLRANSAVEIASSFYLCCNPCWTSLPVNLGNNELARSSSKAFIESSSSLALIFYAFISRPASISTYALVSRPVIYKYINKNLQNATKVGLEFFFKS